MTPEIGLVIAQLLLKYGPPVALAVAQLFEKKEHSLADWNAVFAQVKTYDEIMVNPIK